MGLGSSDLPAWLARNHAAGHQPILAATPLRSPVNLAANAASCSVDTSEACAYPRNGSFMLAGIQGRDPGAWLMLSSFVLCRLAVIGAVIERAK